MVKTQQVQIDRSLINGFTLIEIIVVVVILSIAAMITVPMFTSASTVQLKTAANMIAADIEYAKSMSISRQKNHSVVFDVSNESYQIKDSDGNVISHPTNGSGVFTISFQSESRLSGVNITSAEFDSNDTLIFNYLGSPLNQSSTPLNSGQIILTADGRTITITVEPVTGYVTIL